MSNVGMTGTIMSAAAMESIENMLGELEVDVVEDIEVIEELEAAAPELDELEELVEVEPVTEMSADTERELEAALDRAEVYESVEPSEMIEAPADGGATMKKEKKAKTPKAPKTAGAPAAVRDLSSLVAIEFLLSESELGDEANKIEVIAKRPTQKKIAEKFDNLFLSLAAGKRPSVYTMDCFKALDATGEATSTSLVNVILGSTSGSGASKGSNKNLGTARSQAGQMMNLFAAVGIANRVGQTLSLRPDSVIAKRLRAL